MNILNSLVVIFDAGVNKPCLCMSVINIVPAGGSHGTWTDLMGPRRSLGKFGFSSSISFTTTVSCITHFQRDVRLLVIFWVFLVTLLGFFFSVGSIGLFGVFLLSNLKLSLTSVVLKLWY